MDCNPRVLESLVRLEEKFMPISNYFSLVQKNIVAPWMRQKVTMWMLEVRFSAKNTFMHFFESRIFGILPSGACCAQKCARGSVGEKITANFKKGAPAKMQILNCKFANPTTWYRI